MFILSKDKASTLSSDPTDQRRYLTGVERTFPDADIIVSKTDPRGLMTYVNDVFIRLSGYAERELIGKPHSIIRHPEMPRCIFRLLWETISSGNEIFAYVNNRCKNGDNYWVLAHVTPTFDEDGQIIGYHSNRRCPRREAIATISRIYERLLDEERAQTSNLAAVEAGLKLLNETISATGKTYDEFILSV